MSPAGRYLFVYGTLLANANHALGALLRRHATATGAGSIRARLYIIADPDDATNAYPGAVPSGDRDDRVHGEIYALTGDPARLLATLDEFEHCSPGRPEPYEFLRRIVPVDADGGAVIKAMTYLYTWDVSRARHVPGGRYAEDGSKVT